MQSFPSYEIVRAIERDLDREHAELARQREAEGYTASSPQDPAQSDCRDERSGGMVVPPRRDPPRLIFPLATQEHDEPCSHFPCSM